MILLNPEHTYLLELIKAALFDVTPAIPENANWDKIFEAGKQQCLVPLVVSCVPIENRNEWYNISYQSKAHFMQLLHEQNALVNLFNSYDISFVILKGTAAAVYYPNPTLRIFGDIDFYVSEKQFDFARSMLEQNGYIFVLKNNRHYEFTKNGIDFELHSRFSCEQYKDIDHVVIRGLNNSVEYNICGSLFSGLPPYENGLVLLGHIMRHLKTYGIGLRQVIDWMLFVHKELDDTAWEKHFRVLAADAGLEKLAITVTYMCKKWLGLPDEISWCNNADEDVADLLLLRILSDGNFGRDRVPYENVKIDIKNEGFFKYLQRSGIENWRLAQKYKAFRPFAWLYQMFRYAGLGISGFFTGKKIFRKDKQNLKLEELLKKIE